MTNVTKLDSPAIRSFNNGLPLLMVNTICPAMLVEWMVETMPFIANFLEPGGVSEDEEGEESGLWFRFIQEDDGEIPSLIQHLVDLFDCHLDRFLATGEV